MHFQRKLLIICFIFFISVVFYAEEVIEIKKGDTLYSISKKYNIPVNTILTYNNLSDPAKIKIGTKIKLPAAYKIKKGDTIYKVSRLYNISVEDICRYNNIDDISGIKIGTVLLIPSGNRIQQPEAKVENTSLSPTQTTWPHPGKREKLNDILKGVAIEGTPGDYIHSVSQGKVIWADPFRGFGKMVMVMSKNNYIYVYAGNEELLVKVGEEVFLNSKLAMLGKSARDGKTKAFFFIYKDGKAIEPDFRPENN